MADFYAGVSVSNGTTDSASHSRASSMSSERSQGQKNKEDESAHLPAKGLTTQGESDEGSDVSGGQLILRDGGRLGEESGTENFAFSAAQYGKGGESIGEGGITPPEVPPKQPTGSGVGTARHKAIKSGSMASSIPEVEITIPNDGCLASFSADAMAAFFRHVRLDERLINHLHKNGLDGRKFGRLKDTDLDNLRLNNPVIVFFRDRTAPVVTKKNKQRVPFVL